jgi:uncharacterized protein (TIRG00374 family)
MPARKLLFTWARVLFGVGLLALLVSRVDPHEYLELIERSEPGELALGLGLLFLAFPVLQALRLHVLCARYTGSVRASFVVFMVGAFFNTMLPSNVGGDAVRLLYLKRMRAENWGGPFAMLMLHRATGMGVLLIAAGIQAALDWQRLALALASVALDRSGPRIAPSLLVLGAVVVLVLAAAVAALVLRYRTQVMTRVRRFASECWDATRELGWAAATSLIALTVLFHFVRMLAFYELVRCMGGTIGLLDLLPVLASTALAGVVPLTVGGLGLMEGAISVTMVLFGVPQSVAIASAVWNRVVLLASAAIGGVTYVVSGGRREAESAAQQ